MFKIISVIMLSLILQACSVSPSRPAYINDSTKIRNSISDRTDLSAYARANLFLEEYNKAKYRSNYSSQYKEDMQILYGIFLTMAMSRDDPQAYFDAAEDLSSSRPILGKGKTDYDKAAEYSFKALEHSSAPMFICKITSFIFDAHSLKGKFSFDQALRVYRKNRRSGCVETSKKYITKAPKWLISVATQIPSNSESEIALRNNNTSSAYKEITQFIDTYGTKAAKGQLKYNTKNPIYEHERLALLTLDYAKHIDKDSTVDLKTLDYHVILAEKIINSLPYDSNYRKRKENQYTRKAHDKASFYYKLGEFYVGSKKYAKSYSQDTMSSFIVNAYSTAFNKANTKEYKMKRLMRESVYQICRHSFWRHYKTKTTNGKKVTHVTKNLGKYININIPLKYCDYKKMRAKYGIDNNYKSFAIRAMDENLQDAKLEKLLKADKGLPDKVKKDKYQLKAQEYLKQQQYNLAYLYLKALIELDYEKRIQVNNTIIYYYAKASYEMGKSFHNTAKSFLGKYLKKTGTKGRFYKDALLLSDKLNQ